MIKITALPLFFNCDMRSEFPGMMLKAKIQRIEKGLSTSPLIESTKLVLII
jgi:hypothetical protein